MNLRLKPEESKPIEEETGTVIFRRRLLCASCESFTYHDVTEITAGKLRAIKCGVCNTTHELIYGSKYFGWIDKKFGDLGLLFTFLGTDEMAKVLAMVKKEEKK